MKAYKLPEVFFLSIIIALTSCHAKSTMPADAGKAKPFHESGKGEGVNKITVSGKVQQTFPYCGGAAPSREMLELLATPVAYSGKKFYIRSGKINNTKVKITDSIISGNDGQFSIRLEPGIYSIILEEQLMEINPDDYTRKYQDVNVQCLKEWWIQPYYLLEVKDKDIDDLNFIFHHRCFISVDIPCISYTGPMPP